MEMIENECDVWRKPIILLAEFSNQFERRITTELINVRPSAITFTPFVYWIKHLTRKIYDDGVSALIKVEDDRRHFSCESPRKYLHLKICYKCFTSSQERRKKQQINSTHTQFMIIHWVFIFGEKKRGQCNEQTNDRQTGKTRFDCSFVFVAVVT